MKNSDSLLIKVLFLSSAACVIAISQHAVASEALKAKVNQVKTQTTSQKSLAALPQRNGIAGQEWKNPRGGNAAAKAGIPAQGPQPQPRTPQQTKPSASPLSFSVLQRESSPEPSTSIRTPALEADAAVPLIGESASNGAAEGAPQRSEKNDQAIGGSHASEAGNAEAENTGNAQIFLVLIALCSALAGTAVILYVISKRTPQTEKGKPPTQEARQEVQQQLPSALQAQPTPEETIAHLEETEEEDSVIELAQRFQRGQGEMQLLFSIQAHETEEAPLSSFIDVTTAKAKGGAKRTAKKPGLGRSEAELLMRLQRCGTSAHHPQRIL